MFILLNDRHGCVCEEETLRYCLQNISVAEDSQIISVFEETSFKGKIKYGQHEAQIAIKFRCKHLSLLNRIGKNFSLGTTQSVLRLVANYF